VADARQARDNRAFVSRLLWGKQPGFAAVLELAERDLLGQPGREPPAVTGRNRRQHHHRPPAGGPRLAGPEHRARAWSERTDSPDSC
jgi:hypothetical protein